MRSLVLLGYGSLQQASFAQGVYQLAEQVRALGVFDEVIEAFWYEEPSLRQVLRTVASTDVVIVPVLMGEGYLTQTVFPRELGLGFQGPVPPQGVARVFGGKTVRYTPPVGASPHLSRVVMARAYQAFADADPIDTTLILLGQGGNDNGVTSPLQDHAQRVAASGRFAAVQVWRLGDAALDRWRQQVQTARAVIVPFFLNEQSFSVAQIERAMRLGDASADGPLEIRLTEAVGTHPDMAQVVLAMAQDVQQGRGEGDPDRTHAASWREVLQLARLGLRIGEVLIIGHSGLYDVRHVLDEGRSNEELQTVVTPEGVLERTRSDDNGHYRPVRAFRNLPRGWRAVVQERDLRRVLHNLYPAVVEESYACMHHTLRTVPWTTTARRQVGSAARVQRATPELVQTVSQQVCSQCIKARLWAGERMGRTLFQGAAGSLPCAEACQYLVYAVQERLPKKPSRETGPWH